MQLHVSPKVKKQSSRRRIENVLKVSGNACRYYDSEDIQEQQFAEYIGIDPKYWQMIIHGRRSFTDDKMHIAERKLGLTNGELDRPVGESLVMPDLMWDCMAAVHDKINSPDVDISKDKGLEITKLLYSSSLINGIVDMDKLNSLISLAS